MAEIRSTHNSHGDLLWKHKKLLKQPTPLSLSCLSHTKLLPRGRRRERQSRSKRETHSRERKKKLKSDFFFSRKKSEGEREPLATLLQRTGKKRGEGKARFFFFFYMCPSCVLAKAALTRRGGGSLPFIFFFFLGRRIGLGFFVSRSNV